MSKPLMMKFTRYKNPEDIWVNMNHVCLISTDGVSGSVLTFNFITEGEQFYICVNESPDSIGNRPEWQV